MSKIRQCRTRRCRPLIYRYNIIGTCHPETRVRFRKYSYANDGIRA